MGVGNGTDICEGKIRQRHVRIAKSAFGPVSGREFYNKHTELFTERHKQYSDRTEYSGADAKCSRQTCGI